MVETRRWRRPEERSLCFCVEASWGGGRVVVLVAPE